LDLAENKRLVRFRKLRQYIGERQHVDPYCVVYSWRNVSLGAPIQHCELRGLLARRRNGRKSYWNALMEIALAPDRKYQQEPKALTVIEATRGVLL
jgi:hypothetical protein